MLQVKPHVPLQVAVALATLVVHGLPHDPQLLKLVDVSTHTPLHNVGVGAEHPETHVEPEHGRRPGTARAAGPAVGGADGDAAVVADDGAAGAARIGAACVVACGVVARGRIPTTVVASVLARVVPSVVARRGRVVADRVVTRVGPVGARRVGCAGGVVAATPHVEEPPPLLWKDDVTASVDPPEAHDGASTAYPRMANDGPAIRRTTLKKRMGSSRRPAAAKASAECWHREGAAQSESPKSRESNETV